MSNKKIYRCNRQHNLLWLRVAVGRSGDTPLLVRLLVDTGASYTVLPTKEFRVIFPEESMRSP